MITPEEHKILKVLEQRDKSDSEFWVGTEQISKGLMFSELLTQTGLSRSVLTEYLEKLQKAQRIQMSIVSERYYLAKENGKK